MPTPEYSEAQGASASPWLETANDLQDMLRDADEYLFLSDVTLPLGTQQLIQNIFDQPQQVSPSPFFDMLDMAINGDRIEEIFDHDQLPDISSSSFTHGSQNYQFPQFLSNAQNSQSVAFNHGSLIATSSGAVPQDAVFFAQALKCT